MSKRYLVTGAAGFIGSNLVETLIKRGESVVGVDNFITGHIENIEPFIDKFEFEQGDIRDYDLCKKLCEGANYVFHEAALGSVPRSVDDPVATNDHNVNGTLNVFVAAKEARVDKVVFATSSSAYGDTAVLPKVETMATKPLSPYAVSKYVGELYSSVFHSIYGLRTIGLRYFNVFGPRQDPNGAYAAAIPKFIKAIFAKRAPTIYGDGEQTRDFTYIDNVVQANLLACMAGERADGKIFNIGAGGRITINDLLKHILEFLKADLEPEYLPPRGGDIRDSQADIHLAKDFLGYEPRVGVQEGLIKTIEWLRQQDRA